MKNSTLRCNNCGTSLSVKPSIRFFNCTACGSSLTIEESGNARYAAVVGAGTSSGTGNKGNHTEILQLENEIARLDREWNLEREQYKIKGEHSNDLPTSNTVPYTIIVAILAIAFVLFWISQGIAMGERTATFGHDHGPIIPITILFGSVMIFVVIFNSINNVNKSNGYMDAKKKYDDKRAVLIKKLNQIKG